MRDYARHQTAILLRRFAFQVNRTARGANPEAVHDLRVSVRRLSECLRVFARFYPGNTGKRLRRRIADLMKRAGGVRDYDIAMELLAEAGVTARTPLVKSLAAERRKAAHQLELEARRWKSKDFSQKWRGRLEL